MTATRAPVPYAFDALFRAVTEATADPPPPWWPHDKQLVLDFAPPSRQVAVDGDEGDTDDEYRPEPHLVSRRWS